jgi:hypothetical protein
MPRARFHDKPMPLTMDEPVATFDAMATLPPFSQSDIATDYQHKLALKALNRRNEEFWRPQQ